MYCDDCEHKNLMKVVTALDCAPLGIHEGGVTCPGRQEPKSNK